MLDFVLDQRSCGRRRSLRRAGTWRVWTIALLVAAASVTAVSAVWHVGHETDPDCAVCKLRHQPLADLASDLHTVRPEARESLSEALPQPPSARTVLQAPARAPPLA